MLKILYLLTIFIVTHTAAYWISEQVIQAQRVEFHEAGFLNDLPLILEFREKK